MLCTPLRESFRLGICSLGERRYKKPTSSHLTTTYLTSPSKLRPGTSEKTDSFRDSHRLGTRRHRIDRNKKTNFERLFCLSSLDRSVCLSERLDGKWMGSGWGDCRKGTISVL